jgi:hypothetical protein
MFAWKFGLHASIGRRPARTAAALRRARVVAARFGGTGPVSEALASGDRVTLLEFVQTIPGESPFWSPVPVWSAPADTRTKLPTLACGGSR